MRGCVLLVLRQCTSSAGSAYVNGNPYAAVNNGWASRTGMCLLSVQRQAPRTLRSPVEKRPVSSRARLISEHRIVDIDGLQFNCDVHKQVSNTELMSPLMHAVISLWRQLPICKGPEIRRQLCRTGRMNGTAGRSAAANWHDCIATHLAQPPLYHCPCT